MRKSTKASCRIRNGEEAIDRIQQAGELIASLVGADADQAVTFAHMDLEMEGIELLHELVEQQGAQTVRNWLEPKRDILLAHLKKRGLDKTEDARFAFRKIEAVLNWVNSWKES